MGVLSEETEKSLRFFLSLKEDDWVQWIAQKNGYRDDCDKFDGCYFIVKQMPKYPQHQNCQCSLKKIVEPIPNVTARASIDIRKFTEYIFSEKYQDGKRELFEHWGYTKEDSDYLRELYARQALQKYCDGDYVFKGVGKYYTRIEIVIDIKTKDGKMIHIKSGWALYPEGEIKLSTPFSGYKKWGE